MYSDSNVQKTFDLLMESGSVLIGDLTKTSFESLRVQLHHKFAQYKDFMDQAGYLSDEVRESGLGARYEKASGRGTFKLQPKRKTLTFTIISSESSSSPGVVDGTAPNVSTDLVSSEGGGLQCGDTSPSSSQCGEAVDPSSTQGEDSGRSSDEEDWRAYRRAAARAGIEVPEG